MNIAGKVAVVTGGASGIGLGIVRALVKFGASGVVIADVDEPRAQAAAAEATAKGVRGTVRRCDVSSEAELEALADFTWATLGRPELIFNNAGVTAPGNPLEATESDTRWEFEINVFGVVHGTRVFGRRLMAEGVRGWICNTASHNAVGAPYPNVAGYVASKHAVLGYTDALRSQFGDKLGFSVLCPGPINTSVWDAGRARAERFGGPTRGDPSNERFLQLHGLDPDRVGEMTVRGVRTEEFFIWTHAEDVELVRKRYDEVRASVARQFPNYPLMA